MDDQIEVRDQPDESRLVAELDGHEAELVYRLAGDRLILVHTGVAPELEGHGLGGRLVQAALQRAADEGLTVVPRCPFAAEWIRRHPVAAAAVTLEWPSDW